MTFTNPQALALLLLIPVMGWLAWYYNKPHSFSKGVRFYLQLLVRGLIILLIVLALAGLERVQMADNLATVFVLDVSDSLGQAGQAAGEAYIRQALNTMKSNDLGGIVVFGAQMTSAGLWFLGRRGQWNGFPPIIQVGGNWPPSLRKVTVIWRRG